MFSNVSNEKKSKEIRILRIKKKKQLKERKLLYSPTAIPPPYLPAK